MNAARSITIAAEIEKLQASTSTAWTQVMLRTLRGQVDGIEPHRRLYHRDGTLYMERWHLEKTAAGGVYLHHFVASDDETPHDHPWRSTSLILAGGYTELIRSSDGTMRSERHTAGEALCRKASTVHRIELADGQDAWSLFMVGPHIREWGFVCPGGRWVHWKEYTRFDQTGDSSVAGRGCE